MEEKLKSFGELLKETLGERGQEEIVPADDPITLSEADRNAILEKVAGVKPGDKLKVSEKIQETGGAPGTNEDLSQVPFGELLERTIKLRGKEDDKEAEVNDKIRESVIEKSKMDMTEALLSRFMR